MYRGDLSSFQPAVQKLQFVCFLQDLQTPTHTFHRLTGMQLTVVLTWLWRCRRIYVCRPAEPQLLLWRFVWSTGGSPCSKASPAEPEVTEKKRLSLKSYWHHLQNQLQSGVTQMLLPSWAGADSAGRSHRNQQFQLTRSAALQAAEGLCNIYGGELNATLTVESRGNRQELKLHQSFTGILQNSEAEFCMINFANVDICKYVYRIVRSSSSWAPGASRFWMVLTLFRLCCRKSWGDSTVPEP